MSRLTRVLLMVVLLALPAVAKADPVTLKLNYWGNSQDIFGKTILPAWVKAVNAEAPDAVRVEIYWGGALGKNPTQQAQLVLDGIVDIGFIVPGITRGRFPGNEGLELPGLFENVKQASLVRTKLSEKGKLQGYEDFFVIGMIASPPMNIFSRKPIKSVKDLKGLKIRAANASDTRFLKALGAVPVFMPITEIVEALGRGTVDGATANPETARDFNIDKVTDNLYTYGGVTATLTYLMSRKKFDSLSPAAQKAISKHSGAAFAERWVAVETPYIKKRGDELRSDPRFTVVDPSPADLEAIKAAAKQVREAWASESKQNHELLQAIEAVSAGTN